MFRWLYRRIFNGMMEELQTWLDEPSTQQWLTDQIDAIADRQMQRLYGSIGGQMGSKDALSGTFNAKNIIAQVVASFLAQRFNTPSSNNKVENPFRLG